MKNGGSFHRFLLTFTSRYGKPWMIPAEVRFASPPPASWLSGELGDDLKGLYTGALGTTFFMGKNGEIIPTMAQDMTLFWSISRNSMKFLKLSKFKMKRCHDISWQM